MLFFGVFLHESAPTAAKKMPNSCTDRDQIWHTYAYSSGNEHELIINSSIPDGHVG